MEKALRLYARDKEILQQVKVLVAKNLETRPSIQQLSIQTGMNRDKLKKGFKLLFGITIEQYHISLRMEEAKRLLVTTEKTIYEIAWELGYEHDYNFSTEFKQNTGVRPMQWRNGKV